MHANTLIRLHSITTNTFSSIELVLGFDPDAPHLRTFGCVVQFPITPPLTTKVGSQCKIGIHIVFDSSSIVRYLEPKIGYLFIAKFMDYHFNETVFHILGSDSRKDQGKLNHLDPRMSQCEIEVLKRSIIYEIYQLSGLKYLMRQEM